jgi:hypothetical protein
MGKRGEDSSLKTESDLGDSSFQEGIFRNSKQIITNPIKEEQSEQEA